MHFTFDHKISTYSHSGNVPCIYNRFRRDRQWPAAESRHDSFLYAGSLHRLDSTINLRSGPGPGQFMLVFYNRITRYRIAGFACIHQPGLNSTVKPRQDHPASYQHHK